MCVCRLCCCCSSSAASSDDNDGDGGVDDGGDGGGDYSINPGTSTSVCINTRGLHRKQNRFYESINL